MRVSVIIPSYNRPDLLRRTLDSLADQTLPASDYEAVVVDDGSDAAPVVEGDWAFRLTLLRQERQGPTAARNLGAGQSGGGVLVFVDDDISISAATLEALACVCERQSGRVALGTLVVPPAAQSSLFAHVMSSTNSAPADSGSERTVAFTSCKTGLLAITRRDFQAMGGFQDPSGGWPSWDDVDFGYRAHQRGLLFIQVGTAIGEHWDFSVASLAATCQRWHRASQSAARLFLTHPGLQQHIPMFEDKIPTSRHDRPLLRLRKLARRAAAWSPALRGMEWLAAVLERGLPKVSLLRPLYRWIIGSYILHGYRQGLKELT